MFSFRWNVEIQHRERHDCQLVAGLRTHCSPFLLCPLSVVAVISCPQGLRSKRGAWICKKINLSYKLNHSSKASIWTVVLEKTLESPLDCKGIKLVNPKGNQPWIFIRRTDAGAPILWPPDAKSLLIGKDPDAGNHWGKEEKWATEDKMVGWHHWLNGHEFDQTGRWWRTGKTSVL